MTAPSTTTDEGLERRLTPRQLSMIAIGGAIGVGLFLGSSVTIRLAGPAVIVSYAIGAAIALVMAYALAEMAIVHPMAGSFGVYAERYLSRWAGFVVRATYGLVQIIAIGAEVTAVAIYFGYWFPAAPRWLWVVAVSIGLVGVNLSNVGRFGTVEYWFSLVKVVAIAAFVVAGGLVIAGVGSETPPGLRHLYADPGGFLPHGWTGVWLAMTLVITSYMGIEIIAITAGEAQDPAVSIPRAMRTVVIRLILFYVLAMTVMLAMTPWTAIGEGGGAITGSPFVRAFAAVGIPSAAGVMNLVVISAALSSANTNLYTTSRMIFSLARSGYAPLGLARLSAAGVPVGAVASASVGMALAILLAIFAPERAFLTLYGTAVAGMLFIWIVILATYVRFRQTLAAADSARLPIRLPAPRTLAGLGMLALTAIGATTCFVDGLEYAVASFLPFLGALTIVFFARRQAAA